MKETKMFRISLHDRRRDRHSEDADHGSVWISAEDLDGALGEHFQQGHFQPGKGIEAPVVTNPGCVVPLGVRVYRSTQEVVLDGEYLQQQILFQKTSTGWQGPYQTAILA